MHWTRASIAVGMVGQAAMVAWIAGLDARTALPLLVAAVAIAIWLARAAPATAQMIAWGGLGMTLGWWADLGFASAIDVAQRSGIDAIWCRAPALGTASHGALEFWHLDSWMNAGMLLFGTPVAARHLRAASLLRCTIGMVLGMIAGTRVAAAVASGLDPALGVLVDYALMSAGMGAGMLVARRHHAT